MVKDQLKLPFNDLKAIARLLVLLPLMNPNEIISILVTNGKTSVEWLTNITSPGRKLKQKA